MLVYIQLANYLYIYHHLSNFSGGKSRKNMLFDFSEEEEEKEEQTKGTYAAVVTFAYS